MTTEAQPMADRRILCPVLIGRDAETGRLETLLRECVGGRGRTALVSGEAGIGKTVLLRNFAKRAHAVGARVLVSECTEIDARRPFAPFMDLARAANRVATLPVGPRDATTTGVDRYELYSAFVTLLADLARERPVVVVIEDLHWADEASLELFPHLARKLRDVPLLLVGTYRTDELHRRHPLRPVLAELSRSRVADEIAVRRLSEDEVADFLREAMHLDRPSTVEFRRAMFETCEGNPLFMEEVLRALVGRGDIELRDGSWRRTKEVAEIAIPDTLRDAVLERFETLSAEAQNTLRHAAVIGQRFDFDLLLRVTGSDEAILVSALRAAIDAQLLLETTESEGLERYAFRHALTRESILLDLLQRERRRMHATVGEAIESRAGEDTALHAEELAYHFDEARDNGRAFRYHDLAAREAHRLFAFARAARHLERAVELARDDEPALGELHLRLADAASLAGAPRRALHAAEEAQRWFKEVGDTRRAAIALTPIAAYRWALGDSRAARATAEEAVRLLEPRGKSQELAGAYAQVARLAWFDLELSMAAELGRRAVHMAREEQALSIEIDALITLGSADGYAGRCEGVAQLRQAIDMASAHGMVEAAIRAFSNLMCPVLYATGSTGIEVRRVYEEMFTYARGHRFRTDMIIYFEAVYVLADGDWDAALRLVHEAPGESGWIALIQVLETFIRAGRDGPEWSRPLLDVPRRLLRDASAGHQIYGASLLARTALLAGDARATLEHVDGLATEVGRNPWPEVDEAAVYALIAATAQEDSEARTRWIELALAEDAGPRRSTASARRAFAQGEHAVSKGNVDAAINLLSESAELFAQALRPFAETLARRRRAELMLQRDAPGDREAAQAELAAILPYWRKAKATWYLGQLERWARDLGLDFPVDRPAEEPSPREARSQLTSREREVAALVATGLSNKEIAAKLVISERTAEGHVERILGKLEFRSRSQIASWHAGGDPTRASS